MAGKLPRAAIGDPIGMTSMEVEEGHVSIRARADKRRLRPLNGVHKGSCATVLDPAMGCAVHSRLPAGAFYGAVDLNVRMLSPVPRDQELGPEARVTHVSKSPDVFAGTLRDEKGHQLSKASATCFIQQPAWAPTRVARR